MQNVVLHLPDPSLGGLSLTWRQFFKKIMSNIRGVFEKINDFVRENTKWVQNRDYGLILCEDGAVHLINTFKMVPDQFFNLFFN